jgi:hypothetical protein
MKDLFQANTRLNWHLSFKETRLETLQGLAAKQNAKLMNNSQGEFLERRGFLLLFFR